MDRKNILVVTGHLQERPALLEWCDLAVDFHLSIAVTDEIAIELAHQQIFDLVIIDRKDPEIDVVKLKAILPILNVDVQFISYEEESTAALTEKAGAAFKRKKDLRIQQLQILDTEELKGLSKMPFSVN
jgi:hypothetical protein